MTICIPSNDDRGMDARLSEHFGRAGYFTLVDTDDGNAVTVVNRNAQHAHGQCTPTQSLQDLDVNTVVCRGLGRRALDRLRSLDIEVFLTDAGLASEAFEAYCVGRLQPVLENETCAGGHFSHS